MSDVIQWVVVVVCVLAAAGFLTYRFWKSSKGQCGKSCCGNCPVASDCKEERRSE